MPLFWNIWLSKPLVCGVDSRFRENGRDREYPCRANDIATWHRNSIASQDVS
jgi:hypothetical protein